MESPEGNFDREITSFDSELSSFSGPNWVFPNSVVVFIRTFPDRLPVHSHREWSIVYVKEYRFPVHQLVPLCIQPTNFCSSLFKNTASHVEQEEWLWPRSRNLSQDMKRLTPCFCCGIDTVDSHLIVAPNQFWQPTHLQQTEPLRSFEYNIRQSSGDISQINSLFW